MLGIVKLELVKSDSEWDLFCSLSKQGTFFSKSRFFSELKIPNERYFLLSNKEILAGVALTYNENRDPEVGSKGGMYQGILLGDRVQKVKALLRKCSKRSLIYF